uniref:Major facilitator superfamily (MFS) profile domain-containing protein n=1 Tax=Clastoptera arizonana TaxID=38151 RepID=A0A1B6CRC6_9HEMI
MMVAVPTVVIAALHNAATGLSINDEQASWFAGILYACQPLGSIFSGILSDKFGRKKCMILVSIPQLVAWLLIYTAQTVEMLYIAAVLMGSSIGFMEAPQLSYIGEATQPHLRATLATFTSICVSIGYFVMYLLGTITTWRVACAYAASVPILAMITVSQIPESPVWLIMNNKIREAEQALCWLRGWVSINAVQKEMHSLLAYLKKSNKVDPKTYTPSKGKIYTQVSENGNRNGSSSSDSSDSQTKEKLTFSDKLHFILQPEMFRPFRLIFLFFFFYHCAALSGFRPYMVQVYTSLKLPVDSHWFTVVSGLLQIAGGLCCTIFVHCTGKRVISFISMILCSAMCLSLGWYSMVQEKYGYSNPWIPLTLFIILFFSMSLGISPIPWTLLSEIFPPRGRGIAGGLSAASFYILYFMVTKTFLDMENLIHLYGVFYFYGVLGLVGLVFLYFYLPETKDRKLEDIEYYFKHGHHAESNGTLPR